MTLKKLRDEQTPDERGRTIPLNITNGQIKWTLRQKYQTDNPKNDKFALIGRSEQIDTTNAISSSYACQNCCSGGVYDAFITTDLSGVSIPTDYDFEVGEFAQFYAFVKIETCYGERKIKLADPSDWDSSNQNIATVNSTGGVEIIAVGDVEIDADIEGIFYLETAPCPLPLTTEICSEKPEKEITEENPSSVAPCGSCEEFEIDYEPDANITAKPKIKILRNGQDITSTPQNQNVQNVIVGEKIELTTTVTGGTPSSKQWSIPSDKAVKDYEVICNGNPGPTGGKRCESPTSATKLDLTSSDLNRIDVNFYWWKGGNNIQVQYTITVNQVPYSAIAKFNVLTPTTSVSYATRGPIFTELELSKWYLTHGDQFAVGLRLEHSTTFPSGVSGTTQWVQTYNIFRRYQNLDDSWLRVQGEGVDGTYPYPPAGPGSLNVLIDSPRQQLTGVRNGDIIYSWKNVKVNDSAKTWVMFKPNTSNSIWVPLTLVNWSWRGDATKLVNGNWEKTDEGVTGPTINPTLVFPTWNANVKDFPYTPE